VLSEGAQPMPPRQSKVELYAALLVAIGVFCSACGDQVPTSHSAAKPTDCVVLERLNAPAYSLAFDKVKDALWFPVMESGGKSSLHRYDLATGQQFQYPLPAAGDNGLVATTVITSDGAVWVNLPYAVARWDPIRETITTTSIPADAEGQLPGAVDTTRPLAGTWISTLIADGDGLLIGRLNLPYLQRVSSDGTTARAFDLPNGYEGTKRIARMGSALIVAPGWLSDESATDVLAIASSTTKHTDVIPLNGLFDLGGGTIAALTQNGLVKADTGEPLSTTLVPDPSAHALLAQNGVAEVAYSPSRHTLERAVGTEVATLQLNSRTAPAAGGTQTAVKAWEGVTALAQGSDATVFALRANGTELCEWRSG
jgi:hypothetical protein